MTLITKKTEYELKSSLFNLFDQATIQKLLAAQNRIAFKIENN